MLIRSAPAPHDIKCDVVATRQSRTAVYQAETKWIDASVDLYAFSLNNLSAISVQQNKIVISDPGTRQTFDQKLNRAFELRKEFLASSEQYNRAQADNMKAYGISPSDLGAK